MLRSPIALGRSGYRPSFHPDVTNHCPNCGRSHWLVGRMTAECAFCASAIPIAHHGSWMSPVEQRQVA